MTKKITVVKRFTLNRDDGTTSVFEPGVHDMEDDDADHWFVQAHTDKAPTSRPVLGTPQYAQAMDALVDKRQRLLDEALEAQAEAREAQKTYQPGTLPRPELINGGQGFAKSLTGNESGIDHTLATDEKTDLDNGGAGPNVQQQQPEPGTDAAQEQARQIAEASKAAAESGSTNGRKKPSAEALAATTE